jgi:hypothetical protein
LGRLNERFHSLARDALIQICASAIYDLCDCLLRLIFIHEDPFDCDGFARATLAVTRPPVGWSMYIVQLTFVDVVVSSRYAVRCAGCKQWDASGTRRNQRCVNGVTYFVLFLKYMVQKRSCISSCNVIMGYFFVDSVFSICH